MNRFIITFTISTIIFLALSIGLITAIDPYDKLGNNFFNFETKAVAQSRENKFYQFESSAKNYEAFILGSSAAHRYPTSKLKELTGLETYNYAVQHSTPIDYLAIVKHILSKAKPKLIIIQLDFAGFDTNYEVDNRLYNSPLKKYLSKTKESNNFFDNTHYTLDALRDSLRVVFVNNFGVARHIYLEDGNYIDEKITEKKVKIKQSTDINFMYAHKREDHIKEIVNLSKIHDFKLIGITSPISTNHFDRISKSKHLLVMHNRYKSSLSKIFDHFYDFQNKSLSKYSNYRYFRDSTHPTKEFSSLVLSRIFSKDNQDIGRKLK